MSYRRFRLSEIERGPATVATTATLPGPEAPTVANVAGVAKVDLVSGSRTVAVVATVARVVAEIEDAADLAMEFEERAGILEYDGGFSRSEAERLAREHVANVVAFRGRR